MPALAKRPCAGGCNRLVDSGRCPDCSRKEELRRGKTAERGYGKAHRDLRANCFERDEWRCVDCGWEPEIVAMWRRAGASGLPPREAVLEDLRRAFARGEKHFHADHQIPIEERPDLQHDLDNLRTRCNVCHSKKTNREDGGGFRRVSNVREMRGFEPETAAKFTKTRAPEAGIRLRDYAIFQRVR